MNPLQPPEWLASPLATADDALIVLDGRGRIVSLNEEAQLLSGLGESESWGRPFEEVFPIRDEFSGGPPAPHTRAVVLAVRSGELRAFDLIVAPRPDDAGWSVILRPAIASGDIEHEAWANLAKDSKEGTGLGDPATNTVGLVSQSFAALHGYTPEEMLGLPLSALFPGDGENLAQFERNLREGRVSWESRHLRKDGTVFPVLLSVTTVRDPLGAERFRALRVEDITERKAAEAREEAQRNLVNRVVGLVPSIVYLIHPTEGHMRFLSRNVATALGYPIKTGPEPGVEATDPRFTSESLHPEDRLRVLEHRQRLVTLADGEIATIEYRIRDASGEWRWVLSHDTVFERDAEGRVQIVLGAATDVTELKNVSEELRETEALRDVAASAATMASWWWDLETGNARVWNDEGRLYGLSSPHTPGEEVRTTIEDLMSRIDPRDRDRMEAALRRTMTEGVEFEEEVRALDEDNPRWILARGRRVLNAEGRPSILAGVSIDIQTRKEAEAALHESEVEMRRLVESATEYAIFTMDLERRVTSWNTGATNVFGCTGEEMLGESGDTLFTPEDRAAGEPEKEAAQALATGHASDERWHLRCDGTRFFASGVATPLVGPDGVPYGLVKIARDLTERKRAEEALRASEAKFRTLFASLDDGLEIIELICDEAGRVADYTILEANPAREAMTGFDYSGAKRVRELVPEIEPEWLERFGEVARTGQPAEFEKSTPEGRWYTLRVSRIGGEESRRLALLFTDVTERRLAEERQAFLLGLADALRPLADPVEIQSEAARVLGRHLGAGRATYAEIEADDEHFVVHRDYTDGVPSFAGRYPNDSYAPAYFAELRAGRTVTVTDAERDAQLSVAVRAAFAASSVRAAVAVPLVKGGRLAAVFFIHFPVPHEWSAHEVALVEETAERTWAAVERARVETALGESEEKHRTLFETMDQGFAECELIRDSEGRALDYRVLEVNSAFERLTGTPAADAQGRTVREVVPGIEDWWIESYDRIVRRGEPERIEYEAASLGRWYEVHVYPRGGDRFIALYEEITDRKRTEEALREREEKYRTLFQSIDEGFALYDVLLDDEGRFVDLVYRETNPAFAQQTGIDNVIGKAASELFPHTEQAWLDAITRVVHTGVSERLKGHHADTDRWFTLHYTRVGGPGSRMVGVVFNDISERKRAEREIRASREEAERQARLIDTTLASLPDHVFSLDPAGRYRYANEPLLRYWGRTLPEIVGKTPREIGHSEDLSLQVEEALNRAIETKATVEATLFNPSRTEPEKVYESVFSPFPRHDGPVEFVVGWSRDVTERRRTELALASTEARFRRAFDIETVGILFFTLAGRVLDANETFERMTGYTAEELRAMDDWSELTPPEYAEATERAKQNLIERGETAPYEKELLRKDGSRFWGLFAPTRISGEGENAECVEYVLDITERKWRESHGAFLDALTGDFSLHSDPDEIMRAAGARLAAHLDLAGVSFLDIDETREKPFILRYFWGPEGVADLRGEYKIRDYLTEDFERSHRAGKIWVVRDTATDPYTDNEAYEPFGIRSFVSVPFLDQGVWTHYFVVSDSKPRDWRPDEIELIQEVGHRVFPRVERARAETALMEHRIELEAELRSMRRLSELLKSPPPRRAES